MGIINDIWTKCKTEWFGGLVLVLVALSAFGLGRLSALKPTKTPIELTEAPTNPPATPTTAQNINVDNNKNVLSTQVVGSKEGSKYHYPWCGGAKQIKAANLVTFDNIAAARAAGYTPAGNCPGLN